METGRRDFLSTLAIGSLGIAGLEHLDLEPAVAQAAGHWNLDWVRKLKGKHRAVFDVAQIEDGFGVWRSVIWRKQYAQVFGLAETSLTTVLILRHDAIALALNQDFWTRSHVARESGVKDPATGRPTTRNPVIERTGTYALPPQFSGFTLEALMEGGAVVLACALALRDCATLIADREKLSMTDADRLVHEMVVPGVILQPSGIFAAVLAQENGCRYVRAS